MIVASITPIAATYVLLAGLLLWFVIGSEGRWKLKIPVILATVAFSLLLWSAVGSFSGWPAHTKLPDRGVFVSAQVVEPNPQTGDPGRIYVWEIPASWGGNTFTYQPKDGEPRSYQVPYSRQLHEALQQAAMMQSGGKTVVLAKSTRHAQGGRGKGAPHGRTAVDGKKLIPGTYHAYVLPTASAPSKDG